MSDKIIIKWNNTDIESALLPELVTIEYGGQAIEFRDGKIRVETVEEPEPVFCTCHPHDRVYYGCRCKKQAKPARRPNMPPVMHW